MNKTDFTIIGLTVAILVGLGLLANCSSSKQVCNVINTDSIKVATIDSLQKIQNKELEYWKFKVDSLTIENNHYVNVINEADSVIAITNEDLIVAKYKLERIEYYNKIATGNQLKYLRGWINRVLKD